MMPEMCFRRHPPCFDGGIFCNWSGELFMDLFSVVFWGLRGLILLGVVEPSDFMWRLVPGRSFGVSSHALVVVIFILMWEIVQGHFLCCFLGFERTIFAWCGGAVYFWVEIDVCDYFWGPPPCFDGCIF